MAIDVEKALDEAVRQAGGKRIDELGIEDLNAFKNADYLFEEEGVIAELKRLVSEDPQLARKLSLRYKALVDEGMVPARSVGETMIYFAVDMEIRSQNGELVIPWVSYFRPEHRKMPADRSIEAQLVGDLLRSPRPVVSCPV